MSATPLRRPLRRRVNARPRRGVDPKAYVATLDPDGVELRPLRARDPQAIVYATWDTIYRAALERRARHG